MSLAMLTVFTFFCTGSCLKHETISVFGGKLSFQIFLNLSNTVNCIKQANVSLWNRCFYMLAWPAGITYECVNSAVFGLSLH